MNLTNEEEEYKAWNNTYSGHNQMTTPGENLKFCYSETNLLILFYLGYFSHY